MSNVGSNCEDKTNLIQSNRMWLDIGIMCPSKKGQNSKVKLTRLVNIIKMENIHIFVHIFETITFSVIVLCD